MIRWMDRLNKYLDNKKIAKCRYQILNDEYDFKTDGYSHS